MHNKSWNFDESTRHYLFTLLSTGFEYFVTGSWTTLHLVMSFCYASCVHRRYWRLKLRLPIRRRWFIQTHYIRYQFDQWSCMFIVRLIWFDFPASENLGLHFFHHFHRRANIKADYIRIYSAQRIILSIIVQSIGLSGGCCIINIHLLRVRFANLESFGVVAIQINSFIKSNFIFPLIQPFSISRTDFRGLQIPVVAKMLSVLQH